MEFRSTVRVPSNVFVNVIVSSDESYLCRATNLSKGGLQLMRLPKRSKDVKFVWLLFWLPNSDELVRALGEVVHDRGNNHLEHVGFKFKYLNPKHRRILDAFIDDAQVGSIDAQRAA